MCSYFPQYVFIIEMNMDHEREDNNVMSNIVVAQAMS